MSKAFELIDTPEKWSNNIMHIGPGAKHCAYTAILAAYGNNRTGDAVAEKLRKILGEDSVVYWNDRNEWETIHSVLKENDI